MTPLHLTRQQRRALEREVAEVEKATDADRRFFERFPHRTFRVRSMARAEIASLEAAAGGKLLPCVPGEARFTVVKFVAPSVRLRIFVPGPADEAGQEGDEAIGAWLWERYSRRFPSVAEREAALRKAAAGPSGPRNESGSPAQ